MSLVSMRQLLDHAAENGYGVPAFNVNNLEQVQAIMEAAQETGAPVIMQASAGARKYAGETFLKHLIIAAVESYPDIPVAMHQDHGQSPNVCEGAIKLGFSSVMMDGSLREDGKTIADYDYNVDVTSKVVDMAHALGVSVEGELGCLGSLETMRGDKEDGHGTEATMTREQLLTDPDQAADFVKRTRLDALAIAIGTSHGAYKFSRKPTGDILAIERIKEIHRRIPNTHLVMHGSSSVPQNLLEEIRKYGGKMKETYGVPVEEIQEAIKHGVRKVNIDTDIRLAMTARDPQVLAREPGQVRPARLLEAGARRRQGDLQGALRPVRLRRPGRAHPGRAARKHGAQVPHGRAEPARPLTAQARRRRQKTGRPPVAGRTQSPMAATTVYVQRDGPYVVTGRFTLAARGAPRDDASVVLCRCGHSDNKPLLRRQPHSHRLRRSGPGRRHGAAMLRQLEHAARHHAGAGRTARMPGTVGAAGRRRQQLRARSRVALPLRRIGHQAVLRLPSRSDQVHRVTYGRRRAMTRNGARGRRSRVPIERLSRA